MLENISHTAGQVRLTKIRPSTPWNKENETTQTYNIQIYMLKISKRDYQVLHTCTLLYIFNPLHYFKIRGRQRLRCNSKIQGFFMFFQLQWSATREQGLDKEKCKFCSKLQHVQSDTIKVQHQKDAFDVCIRSCYHVIIFTELNKINCTRFFFS